MTDKLRRPQPRNGAPVFTPPTPPLRVVFHIVSDQKFFGGLIKARDGQAPPLAQVIRYWLQSGTLWRTETSVIRWEGFG